MPGSTPTPSSNTRRAQVVLRSAVSRATLRPSVHDSYNFNTLTSTSGYDKIICLPDALPVEIISRTSLLLSKAQLLLIVLVIIFFLISYNWLLFAGRGEAVRVGWPVVWRVSGCALWRQVCSLLLRQHHVPAVLLRDVLESDSRASRSRVSQAARQGGCRPSAHRSLPLVLSVQNDPFSPTIRPIRIAEKHSNDLRGISRPPSISKRWKHIFKRPSLLFYNARFEYCS